MRNLNRKILKQEIYNLQKQKQIVDSAYRHFKGLVFLYFAMLLFYLFYSVLINQFANSLNDCIIVLGLLASYFLMIQLYYHFILKNYSKRLVEESKKLLKRVEFVANYIDWKVYRKKVVREPDSFQSAQILVWESVELIQRPLNPLHNRKNYLRLMNSCLMLKVLGLLFALFLVGKEIFL